MNAVWAKNLLDEKNIMVAFQYRLTPKTGMLLTIVASNLYRLTINGSFIGYGPARAAHGYSRLDQYSLDRWSGLETVITVEVHSANTNTYYVVDEHPFFAAEITEDGALLAQASDFAAYHMTQRLQKVRRFSFQRSYTEIYVLTTDPKQFYFGNAAPGVPVETEAVAMNALLPRYAPYPVLNRLSASHLEYGLVT